MRNVEIKARVKNILDLIERAKSLTGKEVTIIPQFDTFFNVPKGRFKMRELEGGSAQLVYYERPDAEGPKLSSYEIYETSSPRNLRDVLARALGTKGTVKKTRQLFMIGQTRLHVDSVEGLGDFMELEVVLSDDETVEKGQEIAKDLMKKLGVDETDLLSGAYLDLTHVNEVK